METATMKVPGETLEEAATRQVELANKKLEATLSLMGWYFQKTKDDDQPITTSGPIYARNAHKALKVSSPCIWWGDFTFVSAWGVLIGLITFLASLSPEHNGIVLIGERAIAAIVSIIFLFCFISGIRAAKKHDPGKEIVRLAMTWKKALTQMSKLGLIETVRDHVFASIDENMSVDQLMSRYGAGTVGTDKYFINSSFYLCLRKIAETAAQAEWDCDLILRKKSERMMDRIRDIYMNHFIEIDGALSEVKELIHQAEEELRKKMLQA